MPHFEKINKGFNSVFNYGKLSLGLVIPLENYAQSRLPSMKQHLERVQFVEQLGFKSIWVRDVPFDVPAFGDVGQMFDPFTYLGFLAGQTKKIALGVSSIALPLHHPVHVAKSAATINQLSDGRLIMGVASGDRPQEYPAMGISFEERGDLFREAFEYIVKANGNFPQLSTKHFGSMDGSIDVLPKNDGLKVPMLITGHSRQSLEWNAEHGDGWMNYPRSLKEQGNSISQWRDLISTTCSHTKPFMQPLYIDLKKEQDHPIQGIHLGFRSGSKYLVDYLKNLETMGVNHVALNLRFNSLGTEKTLELLSKEVLPKFN